MMSNAFYLKTGRIFFAIVILAIGILHVAFHNFPAGLLPVGDAVPGREILVYFAAALFILSGLMMLTDSFHYHGALLSGILLTLFLILLHIPKLAGDIHNGSEWTAAFEVVALISGACLIAGINTGSKLTETGKLLFLFALVVYTMLHYVYLQFITTLIPAWLPWHLFWAWLVLIAFFAATVSLLFGKAVRLSQTLLAAMFFIWVLILHIPLVIGNLNVEPQWTSLFICLGVSGVSLMVAGSVTE